MTTATRYYPVTADQIDNQIAQEIGNLAARAADRPDRVSELANSIERLRGQAEVLVLIESDFDGILAHGVEQNWTMSQVLLVQMSMLADLAVQHPGDTWSGRGTDACRAYNDGRREVLKHVRQTLLHSEHFPK